MVHNLGYQYWVVVLTIVCNGTVGTGHLQQVHIAGTQGKGWCVIQRTVDTHLLGGLDDALDAHLLTQAHSHGVDTLGKGTLQRDAVARERTAGIGWSPGGHLVLHLIIYLHRDIFIAALVARSESLVHRLGIDKELEGRTRLALGCYLVILPVVEINVAHPCLYGSRLWLHSHESAVHEGGHILDTIL